MMQSQVPVTLATDILNSIDAFDTKTWPRNKKLAVAYYDMWWDHPNDERNEFWYKMYQSHWNLYLEGEDTYVPF